MKKEIIILGDAELGAGTLTDDFISDKALSGLIMSLTKRKHQVDLILNGDTFDFLKAPVIDKSGEHHPFYIDKDISLKKLGHIHKAHKKVFDALEKFVKKKKHTLYFIFGNHDPDLQFKEVQQKIKKILKSKKNIMFKDEYHKHGVHAEHGNEFDMLNKMRHKPPFMNYKGKKILNLPWISVGAISLLSVKKQHPFLERIKPVPTILKHHPVLKRKIDRGAFGFTFKSTLLSLVRWYDPLHNVPMYLVRESFHRWMTSNYEIQAVLKNFVDEYKKVKKKAFIHVLGHDHKKKIIKRGKTVFIHPDTWRDEYMLKRNNKALVAKPKHYVKVIVEGKQRPKYNLLSWPIKRSIWQYDKVIKNEFEYINRAILEEG